MQIGQIIGIFAGIVSVALAFVLVSSKNTSSIIKSWGDAFSGSLRAAEGH